MAVKDGNSEKAEAFSLGEIEEKWQKAWAENRVFEVNEDSNKKKFYVLEMFPYPSSSGLHMGHVFNYTLGDIYSRFKRMQGFNVLHPMGFDSFGLPAENAAIKAKSHPKTFTEEAIVNFKREMNRLGVTYDWSREVETHKPEYYKWDQWIFLKMFEKGLAYKKKASVNWCSECNTVLANEQVVGGMCWRHEDTAVEVKSLEQWFFKTTAYADELYSGIDKLIEWPELIRKLQKNWIGRSEGIEIQFEINGEKWPIFTTRPDTLFGVTFVVISAQHPRLKELVTKDHEREMREFLKKVNSVKEEDISVLDKEGFFTGSYAIHPLTGEKVPVWAGNFVLADYGSGMVMAVPAHDGRDFEFAKKYKIPIKAVIKPEKGVFDLINLKEAYEDGGILINSAYFNGLKNAEAKQKITDALNQKKLGNKTVNYRLKDWLISRQRFWGAPIPIVYCDVCGIVPVPEKDLPVLLPESITLKGTTNALLTAEDFIKTRCPKCRGPARRETDTMDTFANSSWYYLRYADPKNQKQIFDKEKAAYWTPIDLYIGGKEHACLHLIYIRFYTKFLRDLGLIKFDEPAVKLFNQGFMLGPDGEKMSKSKGNVILPGSTFDKFGVDGARLFIVSVANPDKDFAWTDAGAEGSLRFIKRVFEYVSNVKIGKSSRRIESKLNKGIKEITEDIDLIRYNMAVIKIRNLFDVINGEREIAQNDLESFIKMLSPFCPHVAEELWEMIQNKPFVSLASWPKADEKKIDLKIEEAEKAVEKTVSDIVNILRIVKEKTGVESDMVYLYVIPPELVNYNEEMLKMKTGKIVKVFAVNDKAKYDPEGKATKAKPGKPGIFVE